MMHNDVKQKFLLKVSLPNGQTAYGQHTHKKTAKATAARSEYFCLEK